MGEDSKKNNSWIGLFIVLIVAGGLIWLIFGRSQPEPLAPVSTRTQQFNNNSSEATKGDSKPFWSGTENIQVCKVPYYTSDGCSDLDVELVDNTTAQIHLSSGEYKNTNILTCYGGNGSGQEPKYTFCRSWDSNNQQWDFFPTWVRL